MIRTQEPFSFNKWVFVLLFLLTLFLISYVNFVYIYIPVRGEVVDSTPFNFRDFFFYNYCLKIFGYSIRFFIIALLMSAALILFNQEVKFKKLFLLAMIAEFAFFIPDIIKILWFLIIEPDYSLERYSNFYPLSVYALANGNLKEGWTGTIFRYLNLFEVIYVSILYYGVAHFYEMRATVIWLIIFLAYGIFYALKILI